MSKLYFPQISRGFDSPKLNLHIGDGFEYLKSHLNEYDVIITDSSDPGNYLYFFLHVFCIFAYIFLFGDQIPRGTSPLFV